MYNSIPQDFYPTPDELIIRMLDKLTKDELASYNRVLECTAGDGRIIEFYREYYKNKFANNWSRNNQCKVVFDAIEIDSNLSAIIRSKGISVIADDFLTFDAGVRFWSLIISNLPFSCGTECALRIIELQERVGGKAIFIINAETLKNPYSNKRKELMRLIEKYNGEIEYIQDSFTEAERKTDVGIALVSVNIPMIETDSIYEKAIKSKDIDTTIEDMRSIAKKTSKLEALCFESETIKKATIELFKEEMRINNLLKSMGLDNGVKICDGTPQNKGITLNEWLSDIDLRYWRKFIEETDLCSRLPSKQKDIFLSNIEMQRTIEFSLQNVYAFYEKLIEEIPKSYEENCSRIFDELTVKSHYSDRDWVKNTHYFNGWKTNDAYKIGKKSIISFYNNGYMYDIPKVITDLIIVFENLSGIRNTLGRKCDYGKETEYQRVLNAIKNYEKDIDLQFFKLDVYKKGSVHLKYKDMKLIEAFNIIISTYRGWLPDGFGTKSYSDMDKEELEAIRNFGIETPEQYQVYSGRKDYLRLL